MTWLLAWTAIKNGAGAAFGWLSRYPWQFAVIALCALSAWLWHGRSTARSELAHHIAAEKAATGAQKRVNAAATTYYKDAANVADTHHDEMVADAFDATAAYINQHRVQPQGGTCKAPAPAASSDPSIPPPVPSDTDVAVSEVDVHRCTEDATYAVAAHDWAQSLKLPENLLPDQ